MPAAATTELTDAQLARIPEWVDKWVKIGLSCEPADYEQAESGVLGCYQAAGLARPRAILRAPSHKDAIIIGPTMEWLVMNGIGPEPDWRGLFRIEGNRLIGERKDVRQAFKEHKANLKEFITRNWTLYRPGNLSAAWHAYATFWRDVVGLKLPCWEAYAHDERIALSAGWVWCGPNYAVVADRPAQINMRQFGGVHRLHNETGPSISWRNGTALWHIGGQELDEQIVMRPQTQTIEQIDADENNDRRAVRIERFGVGRYLQETGASVIDEKANPIEGTHEALLVSDKAGVFFWPTCPSGKPCPPLPVPDTIKTCDQARAWLAGPASKYNIIGRT